MIEKNALCPKAGRKSIQMVCPYTGVLRLGTPWGTQVRASLEGRKEHGTACFFQSVLQIFFITPYMKLYFKGKRKERCSKHSYPPPALL